MMEGKGYIVKDDAMSMKGEIQLNRRKSYSVIAMNLETVDDVDEVIRQCESIKEQMTGGCWKPTINSDGSIGLR